MSLSLILNHVIESQEEQLLNFEERLYADSPDWDLG